MEEDLIFNFDDINIKEESTDFISEENQEEQVNEQNQTDSTSEVIDNENNVEEQNEENVEANNDTSLEESPSSDDISSQNSTLYALAQHLKEEGVLLIEDEIKNVESLEDLKNLIKESNERARYSNLNESQKRYQEALEVGIPKNEFEEIEKEIQTFSKIKSEDVEANATLRYEIIAIDLMNSGISQDKAMKLAKLSLNDESNVQDAKDALNKIIETKTNKFKDLVETTKTSNELKIEDVKKGIFEREKLLDSKLNDITKNKLFDQITTKVGSDENGKPLNELQKWQQENPVESSILLNYMYMITNKGKDLGLIKKSSTSEASLELERKLKNLSFDKDGSLLIPDQMFRNSKTQSKDSKDPNNKITINI